MKKLSPSEFDQLTIKGKGRSSALFNSLLNLKEGEALLIEKKDWTRKAGPSTLVRYIEKNHQRKFTYGAVEGGNGWAVKREQVVRKDSSKIKSNSKVTSHNDNLGLKSELILFYLSRIALNKIERIDETLKAAIIHFWKEDKKLVETYLQEIIQSLHQQNHIVIENNKTYLPLRNSKI